METLKLFLNGKKPDVLMLPKPAGFQRLRFAAGLLIGIVALVGWAVALQPKEHFVDESKLAQLPAPEQLPPVNLPGFKFVHPRLPGPTAAELSTLAGQNPEFLRQVRSRADGGKGEIEAAALQELIEPGSVDLDILHRRLMELKFTGRGHNQGKPDRKSTRLNSSHVKNSYAVFCLKQKNTLHLPAHPSCDPNEPACNHVAVPPP